MSGDEPTRALPIRWRHVLPGEQIVGHGDAPWTVAHNTPVRGRRAVEIRRDGVSPWRGTVDNDEPVRVLLPADEADAMILLRNALGAELLERRHNDAGERGAAA